MRQYVLLNYIKFFDKSVCSYFSKQIDNSDSYILILYRYNMSGYHSRMYSRLRKGYAIDEFKEGIERFLQFTFSQPNHVDENKIRCPCSKYHNLKFCIIEEVLLHLSYKDFDELYTVWTSYSETYKHVGESLECDINPYRRLIVEGFGPEFQEF